MPLIGFRHSPRRHPAGRARRRRRSIATPHPFETANRAAIDANWLREKAANPSLFDGEVSLLARLAYRDRPLEGACHTIRFATFLYWRKTRPWPNAEHAFAHAIPVTSDGALIAIRMGARTANPGRVYFAAGSFDPQDFPGGKVDVDLNMAREVAEETGLDIAGLPRDPPLPRAVGRNRHDHLPPLFPAADRRRRWPRPFAPSWRAIPSPRSRSR